MTSKTKNKLKAIVAKSKRNDIADLMQAYRWKRAKFITAKVKGNTFAALREEGNIIKGSDFYRLLECVAENPYSPAKGKLAIFAILNVKNSEKTEQLKESQENRYGTYFGTYVSEKQLTVFI